MNQFNTNLIYDHIDHLTPAQIERAQELNRKAKTDPPTITQEEVYEWFDLLGLLGLCRVCNMAISHNPAQRTTESRFVEVWNIEQQGLDGFLFCNMDHLNEFFSKPDSPGYRKYGCLTCHRNEGSNFIWFVNDASNKMKRGQLFCSQSCRSKVFGRVMVDGQELNQLKLCGWCQLGGEDKSLMRCGRCKYVYYCSQECQRKHWNEHKKYCGRFQQMIHSADSASVS